VIGVIMSLVAVTGCTVPPAVRSPYVTFAATDVDPAITLGEGARNIAGAPIGPAKGRLVVLFHGSGGNGTTLGMLATSLIQTGFHVMSISYDGALSTLQACPDSVRLSDPDCHRSFRGEVAFGEMVLDPAGRAVDHPAVQVPTANSAMNSILKQVEFLRWRFPLDGWEQYLDQTEEGVCDDWSSTYDSCQLRWDAVTLLGFSQGGGLALYISTLIEVARVGMLSAPFDAFAPSSSPTPAPMFTEGGYATPPERIVALTHTLDSGNWRQRAVASALGLPGDETIIRNTAPPYGGSNRLLTDYTPACSPITSVSYHNATAGGHCTSVARYSDVWRHMAGGDLG
jgi:predicted esterase